MLCGQVPDGFAAYVLARRRDEEQAHDAESVAGSAASTQMAISGCFGAPIFNILVVLSVALLTEALHLPHGGERAAAAFLPTCSAHPIVCRQTCAVLSLPPFADLFCRVRACVSDTLVLCAFAGPVTEDVGLSALLFIGFVSQWWVLLILGAHPPPRLRIPCRCTTIFRHHNQSISLLSLSSNQMFPAVQMHLQCMSWRTSRTS